MDSHYTIAFGARTRVYDSATNDHVGDVYARTMFPGQWALAIDGEPPCFLACADAADAARILHLTWRAGLWPLP